MRFYPKQANWKIELVTRPVTCQEVGQESLGADHPTWGQSGPKKMVRKFYGFSGKKVESSKAGKLKDRVGAPKWAVCQFICLVFREERRRKTFPSAAAKWRLSKNHPDNEIEKSKKVCAPRREICLVVWKDKTCQLLLSLASYAYIINNNIKFLVNSFYIQ